MESIGTRAVGGGIAVFGFGGHSEEPTPDVTCSLDWASAPTGTRGAWPGCAMSPAIVDLILVVVPEDCVGATDDGIATGWGSVSGLALWSFVFLLPLSLRNRLNGCFEGMTRRVLMILTGSGADGLVGALRSGPGDAGDACHMTAGFRDGPNLIFSSIGSRWPFRWSCLREEQIQAEELEARDSGFTRGI